MTVMRETSYVNFPSYRIYSEDGGETWSPIREMPFIGHELCLGQLQSGRVLIAFRNMGGRPQKKESIGPLRQSRHRPYVAILRT